MLAAPISASSALPSALMGVEETSSVRPAINIEAFKSLLPPAVEFTEATTLTVAENKYQAINETPQSSPRKEDQPPTPSPAQPSQRRASISASSAADHLREIDTSWPTNFNVGAGLRNNGNTCFLNSALQCLIHTPPLVRALVQHHDPKSCRIKPFCMACSLRAVTLNALQRKGSFLPTEITSKVHIIGKTFRRGRQEDSHEFLRYAIDGLAQAFAGGPKVKQDLKASEASFVHRIFGGKVLQRVTCGSCGYNSDTTQTCLDFSLDVNNNGHIREAFRKYFAPDQLKGTDQYKCDKCKKHVNATKYTSIQQAPVVLTLHLKRFSPFGHKISNHINYDDQLSLKPYMGEGQYAPGYSLYGVICHAGSGPNSGHYIAYVKSRDGRWYEMDDDDVAPVRDLPVKKTAYVLFYMRSKGDKLNSAVHQAPLTMAPRNVVQSMKKRKERPEDEDTGKPFIGPRLPSEGPPSAKKPKTSGVDPQAAAIREKIASHKMANGSLSALGAYGSDDEDDSSKKATNQPVALNAPRPTKVNGAPPTPATSSPVPPARFYGGTPGHNKKRRIPPNADWKFGNKKNMPKNTYSRRQPRGL
ncbi:cysteine proteinase [Cylindrobasidium torrendii FP15055 ss-10]|uniref:Ubiquitin carboxyl-terminal hydrolase n=1 Tax=Cylindrobasidium torrendii FP15055 ss-10 TaxID=1314674 RepID=A0A0D7BI49_9AGAR|nr:cysteine proteinase [Cylindrobasidium torrendii FP15055 ss-10]